MALCGGHVGKSSADCLGEKRKPQALMLCGEPLAKVLNSSCLFSASLTYLYPWLRCNTHWTEPQPSFKLALRSQSARAQLRPLLAPAQKPFSTPVSLAAVQHPLAQPELRLRLERPLR